jgi:hypothetical protein
VHSELLQKWVTIRGSGTGSPAVLSIIQDEEDWLDVSDCADATFWIDCREFSGTNPVYLNLETAPCKDEALFQPVISAVTLVAASGPLVAGTSRGAVSVAPLARWLRWRLSTTAGSGTWDATFRVRLLRSRTTLFTPTQFPGCAIWLRSDLGVAAGTRTLVNWTDQSGKGNSTNTTAGTGLSYNTSGGVNNLPFVSGDGTDYITGSIAGTFGSSHTLFEVVEYPSSISSAMGAFCATDSGTQDTAFSQWAGAFPSMVGRTSSDPAGTNADAVKNTSGLANGTVAIYTTTANTTTSGLYINGSVAATAAISGFTPGSPNKYTVFARSSAGVNPFVGSGYEFVVYNRVLSAAELTVVHRYLGGRYSVAVP